MMCNYTKLEFVRHGDVDRSNERKPERRTGEHMCGRAQNIIVRTRTGR